MRRYTTLALSVSARWLVLSLVCVIPLTAGLPPYCMCTTCEICECEECHKHETHSATPSRHAVAGHCGFNHSVVRIPCSVCQVSTACDCPESCACRWSASPQGLPRKCSEPHRPTSWIIFQSTHHKTKSPTLHPSDHPGQEWLGPAPTAVQRCALLSRFLA